MNAGPEMLTLEQLGMYSAKFERGEIDEEKLDWAKCNACPSCGACSFIGAASTMQIMAEALGLTLPGSALMPATSPDLLAFAREAGRQSVRLAQMEHMRPSDIVTMDSFENAILVHAAISGSTNCLLHIPAIAHELGIEITGDTFDRIHRNARYLLDVRPAGRWPAECFYYAGGVPAIMEEIKDYLHLDVMTVTGKTLGENLKELKENGFYEKCDKWLQEFNKRYGVNVTKEDIIRPYDKAIGIDASFFTIVPDNSLGKSAIRMLRSNDVDCSNVKFTTEEETPTNRLGTYYLETGYGIRPSKVIYDRKYSAFAEYDFSKTDLNEILEGYTWLHLSGITPALGKSCKEMILKCLNLAKEKGMTVSFDGNFRSTLWDWEEARHVRYAHSCSENSLMAYLWYDGKTYESQKLRFHILDRVGGGDAFVSGI